LSTYFIILAAAIVFPVLLSFDKKVAFYRRWKYLFPAMFITAFVFIAWDVFFTRRGVWGFSPEHLSGLHILSIPVEEWLFFLVIPYASVFTFDVVKAYFKGMKGQRAASLVNLVLLGLAFLAMILFPGRAYTFATFCLMAVLLVLHQWMLKSTWMSRFYFSYLLILIPFLLVNGVLTGTAVPGEVVWYNPGEIMGLRIATIPLEDVFYGFDLILLNITLYELFQRS